MSPLEAPSPHSHKPVHSQDQGDVLNRQADCLKDDSQREDTSSRDACSADAGCCGSDPGGGEGEVREGPHCGRSCHRRHALPSLCPFLGEVSGGWVDGRVLVTASLHSQDGDDLHIVQGSLVELCNEHCGHTLEERSTIHVDSGTNWQDEAADLLGDTILLLHALHHQW